MSATADDRIPAPFVRLPRSALMLLSHRCAALGAPGVRALREAGYRAGAELYAGLGDRPEALSTDEFFPAVDRLLGDLGLGSVSFAPVAPSLGAVSWRRSPEAGGTRREAGGTRCHLASGLLGGLFSRAAGRTVAVLEASCRSGGSEPCWFLVGSVERLRKLRQDAREGASLESVLRP